MDGAAMRAKGLSKAGSYSRAVWWRLCEHASWEHEPLRFQEGTLLGLHKTKKGVWPLCEVSMKLQRGT
jgi:hypothetical protein